MTKKITKTISYRLKFIDSAIFITNSFWNIANNLPEDFIKLNLNMDTIMKNGKCMKLNAKIVSTVLNKEVL